MESSQSIQNVYDIVSSLPHSGVVEELLEVVMMNSGMSVPLLNLTNQTSARKLRENPLNRSALIDLMKDVNHSIKRILKACALAYIAEGHPIAIFRAILLRGDTPFYSIFWPLETILRRWDCDEWCPLAENVVWGVKRFKDKPPSLFRTRRFPSKFGGEVYMEVDQEGNVMDTLRNERRKVYIKEQSFSIKKLRKLMS
ncbi:hypothetical protein FRC18_004686 [Serendipita sp. 400]|nr:hypothetical protein FRC18_004686 [Serendipita sp. 400]